MRFLFFILSLALAFSCEGQSTFHGLLAEQAKDSEFYDDTKQIGIVLMGQSNMAGFNTDAITQPYDSVLSGVFICTDPTTDKFENLYRLSDAASNNGGNDIGPEMSLGYTVEDTYNRPVLISKTAVNGAGITPHAIPGFAPATGDLYDNLRDGALSLQDKITALGKTPVMIMVINQGEAETANATLANQWNQRMTNIMDTLAIDGVNIDYVIVCTLSTLSDADATNEAIVITQQNSFAASQMNYRTLSLTPYDLDTDDSHFTAAGQIDIGNALANIITAQIFTGFEPEAVASQTTTFVNNINASLPAAYQTAINDFTVRLLCNGSVSQIREMQCYFLDTQANSLQGWYAVRDATNTGATFAAKDGFTFDGVNDFVNTGFIPSTDGSTLYTLNDNLTGWYLIHRTSSVDATLGGTFNGASNRITIAQSPVTPGLIWRSFNANAGIYSSQSVFNHNKIYTAGRVAASGANATRLRVDGISLFTTTSVSTGLSATAIYTGALNNAGTAQSFINAKIGFFYAAKNINTDILGLSAEIKKFYQNVQAIP